MNVDMEIIAVKQIAVVQFLVLSATMGRYRILLKSVIQNMLLRFLCQKR